MKAAFYAVEPEVPGHLGESVVMDYSVVPYRVMQLDVELDGWLGDDLCAVAGNNYFVTERLGDALRRLAITGCNLGPMKVSRSELFRELYGNKDLPRFTWLQTPGQALVDDFGIGPARDGVPALIVSDRVLECLSRFSISHGTVTAL